MNTTIINERNQASNKENNNKHDLQKIHQSDKVETEQISPGYVCDTQFDRMDLQAILK